MDLLTSKNTLTIFLSNFAPTLSSYNVMQTFSIQGTTNLRLNLTGISTAGIGLYKMDVFDGDNNFNIPIIYKNNVPTPETNIFELTLTPNNRVEVLTLTSFYKNGLHTLFTINLSTTPNNVLDKDLTILNTQLIYVDNKYIPILNLESNDNVLYPVALFASEITEQTENITYIMTNEELTDSLSATTFDVLSSSKYITTEEPKRIAAL